jgi:putative flippase GtrA
LKLLDTLSEKILKKPLTREVVLYILFGIGTTIIGFASYSLFIYIGLSVALANTISHFLAITFAFTVNKILVFRALNFSAKNVAKESFKFLACRFVTYVIDTALLILLVDVLLYNPIISKVGTSVIVIGLNYLASKKIVFK